MDSAKGSPEICSSTAAMKWSRVTNVVSTALTESFIVWVTRESVEDVVAFGLEEELHAAPMPRLVRARAIGLKLKTTFIIYTSRQFPHT